MVQLLYLIQSSAPSAEWEHGVGSPCLQSVCAELPKLEDIVAVLDLGGPLEHIVIAIGGHVAPVVAHEVGGSVLTRFFKSQAPHPPFAQPFLYLTYVECKRACLEPQNNSGRRG
ncbi:hypothetical protein HK102_007993 [Quaeritorhiza haematococci]|nr:hypothetical protein HK102_007993 [Quaeritorhiza haematococci]